MRDNWQMWEQYFQPQICEEIISMALQISPQTATVGFSDVQVNTSTRRSRVRWITPRENRDLVEEVDNLVHVVNNDAFGVDIFKLLTLQFTEYNAEDAGHYDWHNDVNWGGNRQTHRKLSVVIQLTDPDKYKGGVFEMKPLFLAPPPEDKLKKQGTALIFPSFIEHRVTPVTEGTRYSLVAWMEGPKWR